MMLLETGMTLVPDARRRRMPRAPALPGCWLPPRPPCRSGSPRAPTDARRLPAPSPGCCRGSRVRSHPRRAADRLRPHRDRGLRRGPPERLRPVGRERQGPRRRGSEGLGSDGGHRTLARRAAADRAALRRTGRPRRARPASRARRPAPPPGSRPRTAGLGRGDRPGDRRAGAGAVRPRPHLLARRPARLAVLRLDGRPRLGQPPGRGGAARALRADRGRRGDAVRAAAARGALGPARRPGDNRRARGRRAPRRARRARLRAGALGRHHRRRGRHGALRADRRQAPRSPAGFGSGCHPDRGVAAIRAITEAAQTRAIAIAGARDDLGPDLYAPGIGARFRRAIEGSGGPSTRAWGALPTAARDCLRADLRAVVAAVADAGCGPVLAVDLSREPRLAVIRLVVPGLEPAAPPGDALAGARARRPEAHLA